MPDVTRIIEQKATESIYNDDWFVKDSPTGGTTKIQGSKLLELLGGKVDDVQADEISFVDEDKVADLTPLAMIGTASGDIASFDEGSGLPFKSAVANIEPQQDLHGYDAPWVGGAGKNKLPLTVDGIKAVNTYHSWSGNSTTINNVTITIETDSVGNVTGIRFNGNASADITFNLASNITIPNGSYVWSNDQIVNISNLWLSLTSPNIAITLSSEKERNVTVSNGSIGSAYIYASSGNAFNNVVFKPMIRLSSVTDATFAPYSNICPISGWDEVNVTVVGKNIFGGLPLANAIVNAGGTLDTANKTVSFSHGNSQVNILDKVKLKESTRYTFIITYSNSGNNNSLSLFYKTSGNRYPINLNNSSNTKTTIVYTTSAVAIDKLVLDWILDASTKIYYEESGLFEGELTASDFEPYNGQTYNVEFKDGNDPLVVYNGYVDIVSGLLTVTGVKWDLGEKTIQKYADGQFYFVDYTDFIDFDNTNPTATCEIYQDISYTQWINKSVNSGICGVNSSHVVYILDDRYTSETDLQNALNGYKLIVKLTTPLTYQLTPTQVNSLLGVNNVWADTGSIKDAEFIKDATTVINSLYTSLTDLKTLEYRSYFIGGNTQRDENDIFCVYNEHLKHVQIDAHPHTVLGSGTVPRGNYVIARVPFIPRYTTYIPINRTDYSFVNAQLKIRKTEYNNQVIGEISVELLNAATPQGVELCTHLEFYYDDDSIIPSQS